MKNIEVGMRKVKNREEYESEKKPIIQHVGDRNHAEQYP